MAGTLLHSPFFVVIYIIIFLADAASAVRTVGALNGSLASPLESGQLLNDASVLASTTTVAAIGLVRPKSLRTFPKPQSFIRRLGGASDARVPGPQEASY